MTDDLADEMSEAHRPASRRSRGVWIATMAGVVCLAFASLAWRSVLFGAPPLGIVLRCLIAAGFSVLGVITLRSARGK